MKFLILSVMVSLAAGASVPYAYIPECSTVPQGQKLAIGDCRQFAICQPVGLSFVETCQDGLVYDSRVDRCEWPENVPQCYANYYNNVYQQQQYYPQQQQPWYPQQNWW
ncbi:hypothetical protein CpipJ_CPIJ007911 [Culex quinquefasciatus]|uniref:Chitin-binding type-2 domain-containing protein n=4 Tax=Culex pipiens complex TaxID=518105 RepID=B0WLG1_CULQU|nr:hypothetical protein CpipJ_CPIJ007911 [Culex quinquefasciatus]|eukprot:XP_001849545.1 hypothetical protein CpipJ_CPIJ007911 [Culex quinquefasciatus]